MPPALGEPRSDAFYASKGGKISVSFSGWDASKAVLEDQAFDGGLPLGQHNDKHRFGEILREVGPPTRGE
jgi:hypothetical protein